SQATVSLILNSADHFAFSDDTRERVFEAVRTLDYRLPTRKKKAIIKRTQMLLVLTPTLANPYYSELVQTIESYADECGYRVIVCNTFRKSELERQYLDTFAHNKVDGIIYTFLPSFPHIIEQFSKTVPTVIIGEKDEELAICSIELSNVKAGALLAEYLCRLGHKRFAFISTPLKRLTMAREQRLQGMRAQFEAFGLKDCLEVVAPETSTENDASPDNIPYEYAVGRLLTRQLIEGGSRATAFIGVNDLTAVGIVNELKAMGYAIPAQYSVCGYDNVFLSHISTPTLTTIDHHLTTRCRAAVDMVIAALDSSGEAPTPMVNKIEYVPQLIVRQSTGPAPVKSGGIHP
ncbi:MAG: LacI family DNA-binding transcriptional regulator, partial [Clostridia bacterium]